MLRYSGEATSSQMVDAEALDGEHCGLVLTELTWKSIPVLPLHNGVGDGRHGGPNGGGSMYSVPVQLPDFHQERPFVPPRTGSKPLGQFTVTHEPSTQSCPAAHAGQRRLDNLAGDDLGVGGLFEQEFGQFVGDHLLDCRARFA